MGPNSVAFRSAKVAQTAGAADRYIIQVAIQQLNANAIELVPMVPAEKGIQEIA